MDSEAVARALIIFGVLVAGIGGVVLLAAKAGFSGLPGDISWHRGNTSVYFPIVTSLVISLVATIVINIAIRLFRLARGQQRPRLIRLHRRLRPRRRERCAPAAAESRFGVGVEHQNRCEHHRLVMDSDHRPQAFFSVPSGQSIEAGKDSPDKSSLTRSHLVQ